MADEDVAARERYLKRLDKIEEELNHEIQRRKERRALRDLEAAVEAALTPEEAAALAAVAATDNTRLSAATVQAAKSAIAKIRQALQVP